MDNSKRTAVILANIGTPDKPEVGAVRRYLFEFLNDRRVIDLPWFFQKLLVNLIIVPFRAPKSTKIYKMLWTDEGSPLLVNAEKNRQDLQKSLGDKYEVYIAMRYRKPSINSVLNEVKEKGFGKLVVIPMFPQYASSTTGSIGQYVAEKISKWYVIPEYRMISQFYDHPQFVKAFAERINSYNPSEYDHIIFSYHGLPNRQIDKTHPSIDSTKCTCEKELPKHGHFCYKATCYATTRLLAGALGLSPKDYSVAFQSRLTRNWLNPFADEMVVEKAKQGVKKLLFVAPAFVADCLETTVEIGIEYEELFKEHGGEKLQLVESLNDHPAWTETLRQLIHSV
ncbi:ferrochelatase [Sunxiuqinia sp. A32]|uniref:ferrochelatase n=1 Tax=Sunxiuqinia sp. A32 TaxID=3461496 RepID=UPI0040460907